MTHEALTDRLRDFDAVASLGTDAMALLAVQEVGAFSALLGGPLTAAELGERCAVSGWRLGAFLDRVTARGFLVKQGDRYGLVPGDEAIFDPEDGRTRSLGFSDVASAFQRLAKGAEVLRTDESLAVAGSGGVASAEERARFLRYLHDRSGESAQEVAELLCDEPIRSLVDLGSGMGTYSATILHQVPDARAVLVDRPNAREVVAEFAESEGLGERVRFVGGDFLTDDFGEGFDLALIGNIVHNIGADRTLSLLRRLHPLMVPGGRVAVKDIAIDDDRLAPASAGRFAVSMALFTDRGGVFPASEVEVWLRSAGFEVERTVELTASRSAYLVVGRRL